MSAASRAARTGSRGPARRLAVVLAGAALALLAGGCGRDHSGDYFPLVEGRYWQYRVHTETMKYPSDLKLTVRGLAPAQWEGGEAERRMLNDRRIQFFRRDEKGVFRVATATTDSAQAKPDTPPEPALAFPLEVGRTWTQRTTTGVLEVVVDPFRLHVSIREPVEMTYTVEALDDVVRVPAGRFERCLRVKGRGTGRYKGMSAILPADISVEQTDWYAPGVGLVKTLRTERTTSIVVPKGEYLLELEVLSDERAP